MRPSGRGDRAQRSEVDEPRLLHSRDHLDLHPGLVPHPLLEVPPVLGLPGRAGGDRHHFGAVGVGDVPELGEGRHRPFDGVTAQVLHVGGALTEAHGHLLPGQDLRSPAVHRPGYHHMHGVGPHVDSRQRRRVPHHRPVSPVGGIAPNPPTEGSFVRAWTVLPQSGSRSSWPPGCNGELPEGRIRR